MNLKELFNKTVFLFGAGVSRGVGCKDSAGMLRDLKKSILRLEEKEKDLYNAYLEIYNYIIATLEYQISIKCSELDLEGFKPIPNIEDFVFLLRKIINRDKIIPYPLVGNWSDKINRLEMKYKSKSKTIFSDFLNFIENKLYEDWLKFDEKLLKSSFKTLLDIIKSDIEEYFCMNIFTLNYDNVLESYFNSETNLNMLTGFFKNIWTNNFIEIGKNDSAKINYYKLHGSLNWHKNIESGNTELKSQSKTEEWKPLLIFGLENKMLSVEPFISLLNHFKNKLNEASVYILIGYAFNDSYINNFLLESVSTDTQKRIFVVNPSYKDKDLKKSKSELVNYIKATQQYDNHQNIYNIEQISPDKIEIFPQTAEEFFKKYMSNNSSKLITKINNLNIFEEENPF